MKIFDIFAVAGLLAVYITLMITFFGAFFNGYGCVININRYGEAWIEAVLLPIWFIAGIITFVRLLRSERAR